MTALAIVTVAFFMGLSPGLGNCCSTFYIEDSERPVFGKNYDWSVDVGLVIVNKRGVRKVALANQAPVTWTSSYGSVTFNQYGRELPSGGINEAGLVIELLWLEETEYPSADQRPAIGNVQWIQYQLDRSATVDEVIASDSKIRIQGGPGAKIHYLLADRLGNRAAVEFIEGKMVYHKNETMPVSALTNSTYEESVKYLKKHTGFGGQRQPVQSKSSLDRFVSTANKVESIRAEGAGSTVDYAFEILAGVAQGAFTKWSIVYDMRNAIIYFRTLANGKQRFVDLNALDFTCGSTVGVLDINEDLSGDVTDDLVDYTHERNRRLIERAFRSTSFLKGLPAEALDRLSRYPDQTMCQ